jgi:hypothetical protein
MRNIRARAYRLEKLDRVHLLLLPVEQKHLLQDRNNCAKFGVSSIMDTANGILLCWGCHKCFDANLVCINSDSGQLSIADALLSNEKEKWSPLVRRVVPVSLGTWPTKALLKYREDRARLTHENAANCIFLKRARPVIAEEARRQRRRAANDEDAAIVL